VERRDQPEGRIAHRLEHAVVGQVARGDDLDAGLLEPALLVPLDEGDRLAAGGRKTKIACGFESLARWMNGANSGFDSGVRTEPTISPPPR
jgi:hypothetical protein